MLTLRRLLPSLQRFRCHPIPTTQRSSCFATMARNYAVRLSFLSSNASSRTSAPAQTTFDAIDKLNSLQTNASILEALRKAGPRMNDRSLPEMCEHVRRIGYEPSDFDVLNIIHITGTKGKGSTCAFAESILLHYHEETGASPIRTGLFTSPHLVAVRERIRINGRSISEEMFARYFFECWDKLEETKEQYLAEKLKREKGPKQHIIDQRNHIDKPTYFRFLTLLAFHVFMQEKVDAAIIEVGVGGEFDSTNIVERPVVTGVTSLGLDHVSVLGTTLDKIAWHKAGIFKKDAPAVAFEQPPEAMEVIVQRAQEKDSPLTIIYTKDAEELKDVPLGVYPLIVSLNSTSHQISKQSSCSILISSPSASALPPGLAGVHQRYNAAVAISLCRTWLARYRPSHAPTDDLVPLGFGTGLRTVSWPGRGQTLPNSLTKYAGSGVNLTWYLDGAHTIESLHVCAEWFRDTVAQKKDGMERILIFNCTNGRDGAKMLKVLAAVQKEVEFDEAVFCTNVTFRAGYKSDNQNNTYELDPALAQQHSLADEWRALAPGARTRVVGSVEDAVLYAVERAEHSGEKGMQVLTTGSLILVGNQLAVMGVEPV
ncbi:Mur ligase [Endogone sp. FLAS-F59071]|nr:Mur ligase [Endogone sp. FLAS-F59071]|eukprot:RUS22971.1 Mur ligase [Endogone sp. FLAS-F59071]